MKKIIPILVLTLLMFACQKENSVVVSGKITNPVDEPTGIRINYFERNDTIIVNPDGTFYSEIELEKEHLAWFGHGRYAIPLYLVPGAQINLEFDTKEFEGWIYNNAQITGKKSEPSAFLYSLDLILKKIPRNELAKMKVDSFSTEMNDLYQNTSAEIEEFIAKKSTSDLFVERIKLKQKSELASKYLGFKRYNRKKSEDNTLLELYGNLIAEIPLNDTESCKEISEYSYFLRQHNENIIDNKMKASGLYKETSAYINKLADEIIALDAPQDIKDDIAEWNFSVFYKRPDSLRKVYIERYYDVVKNQEYIDEFKEHVAVIERTKPGIVAPPFNYPDINGEMVSSNSFKGKVIYIDVWATWCGPCKGEIPHQKKLETELQGEDIAFVSISVDEDKIAWETMVREKELGGYQLYADKAWETDIIKQYGITGIPRYIIIDKEGKIVEAYASRPSHSETKEKLLKLAQS